MIRPIALGLVVLGAALLLCGCGDPGTAPTVKVHGTVTYNAQPIEGVNVTFTPAGGRPGTGTTDAQGRFVLSTFDVDDGAVPGQHVVAIAPGPGSGPAPTFPARYRHPSESGFTATVESGGNNEFRFDMVD